MSLIWFPRQLEYYRRHIRNGLYPTSGLWNLAIATENHLTAYRHREVYRRAWERGVSISAAGTNTIQRFRFRTGHGVAKLAYVVELGVDDKNLAADPIFRIETTLSGGATTTSDIHFGLADLNTGMTDGPDQGYATRVVIDVDPDSVYEVALVTVDYARPLSVMAYELGATTVDESVDFFNTYQPAAGSPIYDAERQRILTGLSDMYRANGGIVWHWGLRNGAARTRTSATYINVLDDSTTGTPATSDYGFYVNPQYHSTESRSTVPFELAAYGSVGAGTGGQVRLISSSGATYGPVLVSGATGWYTASIDLPASETFLAVQYRGDGVNTLSLNFVSLIEWE